MKTSMYAALFAIVATSVSVLPASATPSSDMLTTSGPPSAFRMTKTSQPTQNGETTYSPKLKLDNTQTVTSTGSSPAVTVPIVSGPPMWWRTNSSSQK